MPRTAGRVSASFVIDARARCAQYRDTAERALAQVDDTAFFARLGPETEPIAVLVKHVGGNLRSRWTEVLTTDGEKPDRHRDTEFQLTEKDTREALMERWRTGWEAFEGALVDLREGDVLRTVTIRSQPLTVLEAISRSLTHTAYHVGQIVLLAKHHAETAWRTLSVPRGESESFTAAVREKHGA